MIAKSDSDPRELALSEGLLQKNDADSLAKVVAGVIDQNPVVVTDLKAGKAAALEFLLGQCMKQLRGAGDPQVLRDLLRSMTQV